MRTVPKELRGLIATQAGLWALFTAAALIFGTVSALSFTEHFSFSDYAMRIHERWRGEYVYLFGSTTLQAIVFSLQLALVLNWDGLKAICRPAGRGRPKLSMALLTEDTRRWIVLTLPILAFINALVRFNDLIVIHRIVGKLG